MELRRKNWNTTLNKLIAGVILILVSLFIALCFITPTSQTNAAVTRTNIDEYNIYFVSAKTKVRSAKGINKVQLDSPSEGSKFYGYQYNYNALTENLYRGKQSVIDSETNSTVSINTTANSSITNETIYFPIGELPYNSNNEFIPHGVNYFDNVDGQKENIFYDEIDNGDYVLINNNTSHQKSNSSNFNVENFYISFGTPYIDNNDSTPLANLSVTGVLYSEGNNAIPLVLNTPERTDIDNTGSSTEAIKQAYYWNQYFDLKSLKATTTADKSETYDIQNQQGKYVLTFKFTRYNNNLNAEDMPEEEFTYTFYLLDGSSYADYPTIKNADLLENATNSKVNEYYYNFNKNNPYIEYNPAKYNVSYSRINNKSVNNVSDTITSTYESGTYTHEDMGALSFPIGTIRYYNGNDLVKEVFVLTCYNYNDDENLTPKLTHVEQLFISRMNPTENSDINTNSYQAIERLLENNTLKFEYKIIKTLTETSGYYTINTYRIDDYKDHQLMSETVAAQNLIKSEEINIANIASFGNVVSSGELINDLESENGVTLNKDANLTKVQTYDQTNKSLVNYKLTKETENSTTTYTLTKEYFDIVKNETATVEIALPTENFGTVEKMDPISNNITIVYIVETDKSISSIQFVDKTKVPLSNYNDSTLLELNKILNYDNMKLSTDFEYELVLEELGIIDITYSYVCLQNNQYTINSTKKSNSDNLFSGSTHYTAPTDFAVELSQDVTNYPNITSSEEKDLTITVSGIFGEEEVNKVTLNGIVYEYVNNVLSINNGTTKIENLYINTPTEPRIVTWGKSDSGKTTGATYLIDMVNGKYRLNIKYNIGKLSISTTTATQISYNQGKKYITKISTVTTYTPSITSDLNSENNFDNNWQNVKNSLDCMKAPYTVKHEAISGPTQGKDKLHVFGSIAYFNKPDAHSDSNYSKLKQIESKLGFNYNSDITSQYVAEGFDNPYTINKDILETNVTKIINKDNIIITDVTPVLWNNFSTLLYDNKQSKSYIYRYTDYKFNSDGTINLGNNCIVSKYSKDIYCQFDGLYIVVVLYKYDNLPIAERNNIYYQIFTFIIDNSSPDLYIEVENPKTNEYENLGLNKYTNKNVRLSWEVPSYFKNDVYVEINKEYFNTEKSEYNFNAIYKNNEISVKSGITNYVNNISKMGVMTKTIDSKETNLYYVELKVQDTSQSLHNLNGNYSIILHYNANGKSTFSEEFIIDKLDISNIHIEPIYKVLESNSYQVDVSSFDSQIINRDFTFRFDKKESKADIYVYYDKIELTNTSDYDKIVSATGGNGITTRYDINSEELSIGTQYIYDYAHQENRLYAVSSDNVLTSNNSCLFLFRLVDEAGNMARFVVFYDTTEPRFLVSPDPDPLTHIVNDTTRVVWGDYKAIKVNEENLNIANLDTKVDNYYKDTDTDNELNLILRYMHTNPTLFNNLKVEKIGTDYYVLIPITSVSIEDQNFGKIDASTMDNYYFFPIDPIVHKEQENEDYITLPIFEDGQVVRDNAGNIVKKEYIVDTYSYQTVINTSKDSFERYITVIYFNEDDTKETIKGAIGAGKYTYSVGDAINNKSSGLIWMNLDKTKTAGFGIFDYSDNINKAQSLSATNLANDVIPEQTSASKLFISSITNDSSIPDYTVTYKHYPYDLSLYQDYKISGVKLINQSDKESYLELTMALNNANANETKTVMIQLTDEDGNKYPKSSYPYSLEGTSIVSEPNGTPKDIYSEGISYTINNEDGTQRIFSYAINTTTDTNKQKVVTEEGLYIFKRTYTDNLTEEALGADSRIIYIAYLVDRNGIINITDGNSVASKLYEIGSGIEFTLGSNYKGDNLKYKKEINAQTIQNNQKAVISNTSNANYTSNNLFDTNKVEVEFDMSFDKHNFSKFVSDYSTSFSKAIESSNPNITESNRAKLQTILDTYIFNKDYSIDKLFKVDLLLQTNELNIINEAEDEYNTARANKYLKSKTITTETGIKAYNFFYASKYSITLNDHAGYISFAQDGKTIENKNYLSNQLKITFNITHKAPEGDIYGKYYGRHNYDNNSTNKELNSLPLDTDNSYAILSKYLQEGQLEPLSDTIITETKSENGSYIKLKSTNNETMIFTFSITNDEYQAQIDPNNIKLYKGAINQDNLIFNRVNGNNLDTPLVPSARQKKAFVKNIINDTVYYAIIIFDNNLDEILDNDEVNEFGDYRLLYKDDNLDQENYYIQLNYVGNQNDYEGENENGNKLNFHQSTYDITVDRIKPMYNLTKLMSLDKYFYNPKVATVTTSNYETLFNEFKKAYGFSLDEEKEFERSDLENYFFALDTREDTSFEFESISELDNNKTFYLRKVDKNNYKFSLTPDDYKAYYKPTYLSGHPQFTPSTATSITQEWINQGSKITEIDKYYRIQFSSENSQNDNKISAHYLKNIGVFEENQYYEIIETDEAGNYRVYGVYIPSQSHNKISYTYQTNSSISSQKTITIIHGNNPIVESSGMNLRFTNIQSKDNFLKATLTIKTNTIEHIIDVMIDPTDLGYRDIQKSEGSENEEKNVRKRFVYAINRTTGETLWTEPISLSDIGSYANTIEFVNSINKVLEQYNSMINNKSHKYYSEYGYNVNIQIVDRIGVTIVDTTKLYNYEINYVVAGATLSPIFIDNSTNFTMKLEGQKGSTYLTGITVYKFNKEWIQINTDHSSRPQIFDRTIEELKKPIEYLFTRGVYKFVFTDNFGRTNTFFYEFGISSTQAGGALSFENNKFVEHDGYTYSANPIEYTYDSSVYSVYIKFIGKILDDSEATGYRYISDMDNEIIYDSSIRYEDLSQYGLEISTKSNITTIRFLGITDPSNPNGTTDLSKYHIKTILASTASDYTWNQELSNKDIFVYDHKIALYTAVPNVNIRNLSGNTLDTSEHLNLTEDFEIVASWPSTVSDRIDFNTRIMLTRTIYQNNDVHTTTSEVASGQKITEPGDYTAYVINALGMKSRIISFSRGEGQISMYAVYAINSETSSEKQLTPSSLIIADAADTENKVMFTYFVTQDYFSYKDENGDSIWFRDETNGQTENNFQPLIDDPELSNKIFIDTNKLKYLDVRVNSNLSIKADIDKCGYLQDIYPYLTYRIYSNTKNNGVYTYRFVRIVFVNEYENDFARVQVFNSDEITQNLAENSSVITSTSSSITLKMSFTDEHGSLLVPHGDTLYLDRYYNGTFVETIVVNAVETNMKNINLNIEQVGLHEFVLRDLAGRIHKFNGSDKLKIYLINQILFEVNGENPINNQIFNGDVNFNIIFELSGLQLYNSKGLSILVTQNGISRTLDIANNNGQFTISDPGYYSIKMSTDTSLVDDTATQISTIYNFVIVDTLIAQRSFSISKGTGFEIEKLIKIVNDEKQDITNSYITSLNNSNDSTLLWLSYKDQGNSIFDVTIRYYEKISNSYRLFNFQVWINDEKPMIISSIPEGSTTKETIDIRFNTGKIYTQIGKGYITLNDEVVRTIDENSLEFMDTITIDKKGTYWLKIFSEDDTLICSYKFVKSEPLNNITKLIIICVAIGLVLIVVIFFLLRRKGKYR